MPASMRILMTLRTAPLPRRSACPPEIAATGSIVTTPYNAHLLKRRVGALEQQLRFFSPAIAQPKDGDLKYSISPELHAVFAKAVATHDLSKPYRLGVLSNTRETLFFALCNTLEFAPLKDTLSIVAASPTQENADDLDYLIQLYAHGLAEQYPNLVERLYCTPDWYTNRYDAFLCNSALIYEGIAGMRDTVTKIRSTKARHVVFNNLFPTQDPEGKGQWIAQRYEGGIIPLHKPGHNILTEMMHHAGYARVSKDGSLATYDAAAAVKEQMGPLDHLSFELVA